MKFTIFHKPTVDAERIVNIVKDKAIKIGLEYDDKNPEVVIFVGGDGTFLRVVQHYINDLDNLYFFGLNSGNLGYFYEYDYEEIEVALKKLINKELRPFSMNLIKADVDCLDGKTKTIYAVNEIRIENPFRTLTCDVFVGDELLETYRGTGLLMCSPIGSSAYNRSLGGAIIDPSLKVMEVSEIAPIQNSVYRSLGSPIIVPENQTISLRGDFKHTVVGYDHLVSELEPKEMRLSTCNKSVKILYTESHSYISNLIKSFIK